MAWSSMRTLPCCRTGAPPIRMSSKSWLRTGAAFANTPAHFLSVATLRFHGAALQNCQRTIYRVTPAVVMRVALTRFQALMKPDGGRARAPQRDHFRCTMSDLQVPAYTLSKQ